MAHNQVHYKTESVDGIKIFYREAGSPSLPGLLLLHGHVSASHTFRNIIPDLSQHFHIVAPDYPGFGQSDLPDPKDYTYNFVNVSATMDKFTEQIGLKSFFVYIFDYGAPVGMGIAVKHPERILGIFTQSGNAYDDGLSPAFEGLRAFWADSSADAAPKHMFSHEGIDWAYFLGLDDPSIVGPDAPNLDKFYISRPGAYDVQMRFLKDYENVVTKYPEWQAYLRKHQPKIVAVWGAHDPFFQPPGAEAFKRDVPNADITILQGACHFLNESHPQVIVEGLKRLLSK